MLCFTCTKYSKSVYKILASFAWLTPKRAVPTPQATALGNWGQILPPLHRIQTLIFYQMVFLSNRGEEFPMYDCCYCWWNGLGGPQEVWVYAWSWVAWFNTLLLLSYLRIRPRQTWYYAELPYFAVVKGTVSREFYLNWDCRCLD